MTAQKADRGLRPGGPGVFRGGVRAFSSCAFGFSFVFCARIAARTSPGAAGTTTFAGLRRARGGVRERRRARMAARRSPPPAGAGRRAGLALVGRAPSERARIAKDVSDHLFVAARFAQVRRVRLVAVRVVLQAGAIHEGRHPGVEIALDFRQVL